MAEKAKKICFVVGAIGEADSEARIHADWLLEEIIEPVFAEFDGFEVVRSDKIAAPGMIDAQIIGHLLESEVVVADLSGTNPNAFYEIGLRHMIQKPIVHMQLAEDKIPFDVSLYRAIKFSRVRPADIRRARDDLKAAIEMILSDGYKVDNPVTRARGQISLQLQASPSEKVLSDQLRALQQRVGEMEKRASSLDSSEDQGFLTDALHVTHSFMGVAQRIKFTSFLRSIFGPNIGAIKTSNTITKADIAYGKLNGDEIEELEKAVSQFSGVAQVAILPF